MGLVYRNTQVYLYTSVRRAGRVVTRYEASGEQAIKLAWIRKTLGEELRQVRRAHQRREAASRQTRRLDRVARREQRADRLAVEGKVDDFVKLVDELYHLSMYLTGHYLHHREWRMSKRNCGHNDEELVKEKTAGLEKVLVCAFNEGGMSKAWETVRESLESSLPADTATSILNRIAELVGDPARNVFNAMLDYYCGDDVIKRDCIERQVAAQRTELVGKDPSRLRQLMIECFLVCWLDYALCSEVYFNFMLQKDRPITTGDFLDRARDRAARRLVHACKALSLVQREVLPRLKETRGKDDPPVEGLEATRLPRLMGNEKCATSRKLYARPRTCKVGRAVG